MNGALGGGPDGGIHAEETDIQVVVHLDHSVGVRTLVVVGDGVLGIGKVKVGDGAFHEGHSPSDESIDLILSVDPISSLMDVRWWQGRRWRALRRP